MASNTKYKRPPCASSAQPPRPPRSSFGAAEGDGPSLLALVAVIPAPAALGDALRRWLGVDRAAPPEPR
jgi:hypothetical protein